MTTTRTSTLAQATEAALRAAPVLAATPDRIRADWLRAVADAIEANAEELAQLADAETHLGAVRLRGEVGRTCGQLRLFAAVITDGGYLEVTIDHADTSLTPPRPDLRRMLRPLGPVAVFAASNFPFAFSVAGGDTASALAAGCPVIVKAHSGHLQTSIRTAAVVAAALTEAGAPQGCFALVAGREVGSALVQDPAVAAVGFTGSLSGGRALFDLAVARPDPIPFYGELGSVNPVVITEAAISHREAALAAGLAGSFTMGLGQFCTKPGVVFIPAGSTFGAALVAAVKEKGDATSGVMLTQRIADAYPAGLQNFAADEAVTVLLGNPQQDSSTGAVSPAILSTTAAAVRQRPEVLLEECFGPVTLLVEYFGPADLEAALTVVPGSLTATVHAESTETQYLATTLVPALTAIAGRVLFGGWPTGVAVTWSQHHGGPWPATTAPLHTSVGATAIRRFLRPVTYQDAPQEVLPAALKDGNPLGIPRRIDGTLTV